MRIAIDIRRPATLVRKWTAAAARARAYSFSGMGRSGTRRRGHRRGHLRAPRPRLEFLRRRGRWTSNLSLEFQTRVRIAWHDAPLTVIVRPVAPGVGRAIPGASVRQDFVRHSRTMTRESALRTEIRGPRPLAALTILKVSRSAAATHVTYVSRLQNRMFHLHATMLRFERHHERGLMRIPAPVVNVAPERTARRDAVVSPSRDTRPPIRATAVILTLARRADRTPSARRIEWRAGVLQSRRSHAIAHTAILSRQIVRVRRRLEAPAAAVNSQTTAVQAAREFRERPMPHRPLERAVRRVQAKSRGDIFTPQPRPLASPPAPRAALETPRIEQVEKTLRESLAVTVQRTVQHEVERKLRTEASFSRRLRERVQSDIYNDIVVERERVGGRTR